MKPPALSEEDIRRILGWAYDSDGESYIDEKEDWPLIQRLAEAIDEDPTNHAPYCASRIQDEQLGLDQALNDFESQTGRWPNVDEQARIRYDLQKSQSP